MKLLLSLSLSFFFSTQLFAIPKVCYSTVDGGEFCTTDNIGKVQAFIYGAGWCGGCNQEMTELGPLYKQFEGKNVVFASLSGEGFQNGSKPTKAFLEAWKKKHNIPFVVAGKFRDFGGAFGTTGYVPFSVVVDAKGDIVKKGNLSAHEIVDLVNEEVSKEQDSSCYSVKDFFDAIRGDYKILKVTGPVPQDPSKLGHVYVEEGTPDLDVVYMPYCTDDTCYDSGNRFFYSDTTVTVTSKGYQLELKSNGQSLKYDWEDLGNGKFLFRNHQFEFEPGQPTVFEHELMKVN